MPGYTIHADAGVRAAATEAVMRCMRALPEQRNELLLAAADLLARLPDDLPDVRATPVASCSLRAVVPVLGWYLVASQPPGRYVALVSHTVQAIFNSPSCVAYPLK